MDLTPEEITQAILDDRMIIPDGVDRAALAHEISALIRTYGESMALAQRERDALAVEGCDDIGHAARAIAAALIRGQE